jgi:hypothetical protein
MSFFKTRKYKKMTCSWPSGHEGSLDLNFEPPTINNVRIDSHIEEAISLGRPSKIEVLGSENTVHFEYDRCGLILEYDKDRLAYIAIITNPVVDLSPKMTPARATVIGRSGVIISQETTPNDIISILGTPQSDETDEKERFLIHEVGKYTIETEFSLEQKLIRLNLFPK